MNILGNQVTQRNGSSWCWFMLCIKTITRQFISPQTHPPVGQYQQLAQDLYMMGQFVLPKSHDVLGRLSVDQSFFWSNQGTSGYPRSSTHPSSMPYVSHPHVPLAMPSSMHYTMPQLMPQPMSQPMSSVIPSSMPYATAPPSVMPSSLSYATTPPSSMYWPQTSDSPWSMPMSSTHSFAPQPPYSSPWTYAPQPRYSSSWTHALSFLQYGDYSWASESSYLSSPFSASTSNLFTSNNAPSAFISPSKAAV